MRIHLSQWFQQLWTLQEELLAQQHFQSVWQFHVSIWQGDCQWDLQRLWQLFILYNGSCWSHSTFLTYAAAESQVQLPGWCWMGVTSCYTLHWQNHQLSERWSHDFLYHDYTRHCEASKFSRSQSGNESYNRWAAQAQEKDRISAAFDSITDVSIFWVITLLIEVSDLLWGFSNWWRQVSVSFTIIVAVEILNCYGGAQKLCEEHWYFNCWRSYSSLFWIDSESFFDLCQYSLYHLQQIVWKTLYCEKLREQWHHGSFLRRNGIWCY